MSDHSLPDDRDPQSQVARNRFLLISLMRLSGAAILLFGIMISMERFDWARGDLARYLGFGVSIVGLIDFFVVPRLLARAFASKPDQA